MGQEGFPVEGTNAGTTPDLTGPDSDLSTGTGTVVVIIESADGTAAAADDLLSGRAPVARVAGAEATRSQVGGVAEELTLDEVREGAIVVEDAQWVDSTSLGRLQRLVKDPTRHLLMVLAHRPLAGVEGWGIERLADVARRHVTVHRIQAGASDEELATIPSGLVGADLVIAAGLTGQSISVPVAARLLEVSEGEALTVAEQLVDEGLLRETRTGFSCVVRFEVGEARTGYVASRLAETLEAVGGSPDVIGHLWLAAGESAAAFPHLVAAVAAAERSLALAEAFHLASSALEAAEEVGRGADLDLGHLHLVCARFLRLAGRSDWAVAHIDKAVALLEGVERIDALGFAAALADDRQRPQEAERILAAGEWEAARLGETGKLGSLTSFRAQALHRIGFTAEADVMSEKAKGLLESDSSEHQRFYAAVNRAWIMFDRGEVARAEMAFAGLRQQAADLEGDGSVADKEAWRARALFAAGRPAAGLEAVSTAEELADRADVEGPVFLAELALTDGNLAFGRYEESLAAADRVLDLVERQLPAWENVARCGRALAFLRLGRIEEATEEIEAAALATPEGPNGWRWRVRARAIHIEIEVAAGRPLPDQEAVDLADLMLQSGLKGWAAELLCVIAEKGKRKDREVAQVALEQAVELGNPMLAARAATAGRLWQEPVAAPAVRAIRDIESRLPAGWEDDWRSLTSVQEALTAPEPSVDDERQAESVALDKALRRAGLAGVDVVLSPAQRRSGGLVRRRRIVRPLQVVAAGLMVVALAGGTAWAVSEMQLQAPPSTVLVQVTAPPPEEPELTLEQTELSPPVDRVTGDAFYRGDQGRSGFVASAGAREVNGFYWRFSTAARVDASPVAYGSNVLVGSADGTFYALDQTTGTEAWRMSTGGEISAAPGMGRVTLGEGQSAMLALVVSHDGTIRARDAIQAGRPEVWQTPRSLGAAIRSSPVVFEDRVAVATSTGVVYGLDLNTGEIVWTYPDSEEAEAESDLGPISAALSLDEDGVLYVGTEGGELHLVDMVDGSNVCVFTAGEPITVNPIVADGVVYVPTRGFTIHTLPAGACAGSVPNRLQLYVTERAVEIAPAVVGDVMYLADGRFLYAIDLLPDRESADVWPPSTVVADGLITAAPVVANDTVYFGSADGVVHAVDATDGSPLWTWQTGNTVQGSPAVVDGVVFIASRDGWVYAVGP